jgi:hypothetical protein
VVVVILYMPDGVLGFVKKMLARRAPPPAELPAAPAAQMGGTPRGNP